MRSKTTKLSKAKADKYFSKFIRARDAGSPCITCGSRVAVKDCGHFMSRRFEATRYDENNSHGQCLKCNRFENGNQQRHGERIDEIYGKGTRDEISRKSKMFCKRGGYDYEAIAERFKKKIEDL